jgi:hypothetical protein
LTVEKEAKDREVALFNKLIRNSKKKEQIVQKELEEVEYMFRRLLDADLVDKVSQEIEYLNEMIKGEALNI